MPERNPGRSSPDDLLRGIVADQAQGKARFDEIFRRLKDVEATSSEARDIGKEVLTVLREQNALARIEAVGAEVTGRVEALRQDTVHAFDLARKHVDAKVVEIDVQLADIDGRIASLESLRERGRGMASLGRFGVELAKILIAAGAGGLIVKLAGG